MNASDTGDRLGVARPPENGRPLSLPPPHPTPSALKRVAVLANPKAGSETSRRLVEALVKRLAAKGLEPVVCWRREDLSAEVATRRDELRCVVAAGGDGTVMEVVNRAPGVPVAVLPLGTENLTARHWGVARCTRAAADAVAAAKVRRFDLARADGRTFCLMASAGFDAGVVHRVHRRRRGHINRLTYAVPILQTLGSYDYPPIDVTVEDTGERLRGSLVFVFNLPRYGLRLPLAPDARPDDGLLDVYVFERPGFFALARYLFAVLRGRHTRLPDVRHRQVRRVRLSSGARVPLQIDGDPAGLLPVTIEVVPGALALVLP
jgi:YegS/Rv2252/BmrU family lipid kinase